MMRTNVRCPICGQLNEGVDLEETGRLGGMLCL